MPTPRRFNQEELQAIWLDLRTDSYYKIAQRNGVTPSAIQSIVKGYSYKAETSKLCQSAIAISLHAIEKRTTKSKRDHYKKRPMPSKADLIATFQELGTQYAVALKYDGTPRLIKIWTEHYGITKCDYKHKTAKYDELEGVDIPLIRQLHKEGETIRSIAVTFNVHRDVMSDVINGKTWKDVSYLDKVAF